MVKFEFRRRLKEKHTILYEVLDCINTFDYARKNPLEFFLQIITTVIVSFIDRFIVYDVLHYRRERDGQIIGSVISQSHC